jgi:hypothetical protein
MQVHSATCSCSVELCKQWHTLADFLPNWDISRGFLYISLISKETPSYCDFSWFFIYILFAGKISEAAMCGAEFGGQYMYFIASVVEGL